MKLLLLALLAQAPTEDAIKTLHPKLPEARVRYVAKAIDRAAEKYEVDSNLLVAIAKQESNFRSGLVACWQVERYGRVDTTCDYGIAQINQLWIRVWNLDPFRLQYDDRYNLMVAARILRMVKDRHEESEPGNWFGRYHSGTPSKRAIYEEKLLPLLAIVTRQQSSMPEAADDPRRSVPDKSL